MCVMKCVFSKCRTLLRSHCTRVVCNRFLLVFALGVACCVLHVVCVCVCVCGTGHPLGHPKSSSRQEELQHLKAKVDAGADYIVTQVHCLSGASVV